MSTSLGPSPPLFSASTIPFSFCHPDQVLLVRLILKAIDADSEADGCVSRLAGELAAMHVRIDSLQELHPEPLEARIEGGSCGSGKAGVFGKPLKPTAHEACGSSVVLKGSQHCGQPPQIPEIRRSPSSAERKRSTSRQKSSAFSAKRPHLQKVLKNILDSKPRVNSVDQRLQ
jgi:hypothetical protein